MSLRVKKHMKRAGIFIGGILVLLVLGGLAVFGNLPVEKVANVPNILPHDSKPKVESTDVSSRMAVFGNIFWGRYINDWSMASPLKTAYPFSRLNEFHRDKYDAWITGLECPTKSGVNMTSAEMEVALQFNCDPSYIPEAAKWFTAVTLANNHTDNQEPGGFAETQAALEKAGIQYFGHYDPYVTKDLCDVLSIPVHIKMSDDSVKKGDFPMAFCGYHGVFKIPPDSGIDLLSKYSKVMPTFALPHMGLEYQPLPDAIKIATYHKMIDAGADVVLGDHPHWIQNTEVYHDHLIVYSLGNFIFDQQSSLEVTRGAGVVVDVEYQDMQPDVIQKWLDIGAQCKAYHDDCLQLITDAGLEKPKFTMKFDAIGSRDNDKITHPASVDDMKGILTRLNWADSMSKLKDPYGSL